MTLSLIIPYLIAFFALFFTDYFWSKYIQAIEVRDRLMSSLWAVLLFVFGAIAVSGYVDNKWLIIPSALGAFLGTWVSVKPK